MERAEFERKIKQAIGDNPHNGQKWKPLERVFGLAGIRGGGALNNQEAERRSRVRQLFTTRKHPEFDDKDKSTHGVYVINLDAADRQRKEEADGGEEGKTYLEKTEDDILLEASPLTSGVIIFRFDPELDDQGRPTTEEVDECSVAVGDLIPLKLIVWEEDVVIRGWSDWYDVPTRRVEGDARGALRPGPAENILLRRGKLIPPSSAPDSPLLGVDDAFEKAVAALRSGKHVVLYGPPGTGKTELAEYLCTALIESPPNHYAFSTATSDWTTFDTIGGYMPEPVADGGTMLDFHSGVVTRALGEGRWLIIDEINRADVDKAFGELFTLLSGKSVTLPFKKHDGQGWLQVVIGEPGSEGVHGIPISGEWRIIGTLNTFDKASLYQLSYAFMRRLAYRHRNPSYGSAADLLRLLEQIRGLNRWELIRDLLLSGWLSPISTDDLFELYALTLTVDVLVHDLGFRPLDWGLIKAGRAEVMKMNRPRDGRELSVFFDQSPDSLALEVSRYLELVREHSGLEGSGRRPDVTLRLRLPTVPETYRWLLIEVKKTEDGRYKRDSVYKGFAYVYDFAGLFGPAQMARGPAVVMMFPTGIAPLVDRRVALRLVSADDRHAFAATLLDFTDT